MSGRPALRVGTRGSALALWQTERVRRLLADAGHATERIEIRTTGDMVQDVPLARIGSAALFTRQIDEALLDGRIDLGVHSLKDLPTDAARGHRGRGGQRAGGSERCARGPWADPVERGAATVLRSPPAAFGGRPSSSMRGPTSGSAISAVTWTPDSAKLDSAEGWSAILLAAAGLLRLGLGDRIGERLPSERDAAGAGTGSAGGDGAGGRRCMRSMRLGPRCTTGRARSPSAPSGRFFGAWRAGARCRWPPSRYSTLTIRCGCTAGSSRWTGAAWRKDASPHGSTRSPDAEQLGTALAERLIREGAAEILAEVRAAHAPSVTEP